MRLDCIAVVALLAGCASVAGDVGASREWRVDNLESIGDLRPQVIGAPKVIAVNGVNAVCFDGESDGLFLPANPIEGWPRFTVEIQLRPAAGGPAEQRFLHIEDELGRRALIETRVADRAWSLDTFLRASDSDKLTLLDRARTQPTDTWHWAALVYDGATMSHYVDGEKQLAGQVSFPAMGPGRISLGVRQNRVHWFKGCIARVRFTPQALSASELRRAR